MTELPGKLRVQRCCRLCRWWEVRYKGVTLARCSSQALCYEFIRDGGAAAAIARLNLDDGSFHQRWP